MNGSILSFVTAWYNLPFTILLILGAGIAVLQLVGLGGEQDQEAGAGAQLDHDVDLDHDLDLSHDVELNHDLDLDHDVDLDHDLDLDHDVDLDHNMDLDHEVDVAGHLDHEVAVHAGAGAEVDHAAPSIAGILAFLGVGKAPLLVVILMLFGLIGLIGLALNGGVHSILGFYPGWMFTLVLPISFSAGGVISSRIARLIGEVIPPISTTASRAQALVGMRGTVISPFVDQKYGQVHLRNEGGTLITIFAVTASEDPIRRGEEVVLVSYDPSQKFYLVTRSHR